MFSFHTTLANLKNAATPAILDLCLWEKLDQENHKIIVTTSFSSRRHPFSKSCFRSTRKRKAKRFQKAPSSWRIRVDGGPNGRNRAALPKFFRAVWKLLKKKVVFRKCVRLNKQTTKHTLQFTINARKSGY